MQSVFNSARCNAAPVAFYILISLPDTRNDARNVLRLHNHPPRTRCEFIKLAPTPVSDAHMIFRELHYPPWEPREIRAWLWLIISFSACRWALFSVWSAHRGKDRDSYCRFVCTPNPRLDWWYYRTKEHSEQTRASQKQQESIRKNCSFAVRFYLSETLININSPLIQKFNINMRLNNIVHL